MTDIQNIALTKLIRSDINVRKTGGQSIDDLAASIEAHGLLQSLVVTPAGKGKHAVIAGGRRLAAMQRLAKEGRLPKAHPVPCQIVDAAAAAEASLAENTVRTPMHPADQFEAFRALIDAGASIEDVAARFGVSTMIVRQRLKLANLSPRLMALYREDGIKLDQLQALAITDDHAAQERAWFDVPTWNRDARAIRHTLTEQEINASNDKHVFFVGIEAYEAAGGGVRRDLFNLDHAGFLTDAALLDRLVAEKLESAAEAIRAEGWAWTEARPSFDYSESSQYGRVYPTHRDFTVAENAEIEALTAEYDELVEQHGDYPDEPTQNRIGEINARIDALQAGQDEWTADALAKAGAIVTIAYDGSLKVQRGWVRPEDRDDRGDGRKGSPAEKEKPKGLSAALVEDLTAQRTLALRATMMDRPDIALIAVTHNLALPILYSYARIESAMSIRSSSDSMKRFTADEESPAGKAIQERADAWGEKVPADPSELWGWLLEQDQQTILALLAYCSAQTVNVVRLGHEESTAPRLVAGNDMADALDLDMADWWTPAGPRYLERVSKPLILDAVREGVSTEAADALGGLKKAALAAEAEKRLSGRRWLPAMLRRADDEEPPRAEAAE